MLRRLILALALSCAGLAVPAAAAIWPEYLGTFTRQSARPVQVTDRVLWEEFGLEEAEQAEYASGEARYKATAYRLRDATLAMAVFQWLRPAGARASELSELAVESDGNVFFKRGNYVLLFEGHKPQEGELIYLFSVVPRLEESSLPALRGYLPQDQLIAGTERFVVGPVSLERFEPRIAPSAAGFHYGTEAQLGRFRGRRSEMSLAIFSYPTPQIARERGAEFQKTPGWMVKRTGPLVAVIPEPPDADDAERLLAKVNYQASIAWNEELPKEEPNMGDLIIGVGVFTGFLLLFALLVGATLAGYRYAARKWFGKKDVEDPMIVLNLSDR